MAMAWRGRPEAGALALLALALCARGAPGRTLLWHSAVVGLEYADPRTNRTVRSASESGRFGDSSPREPRRGLVRVPSAPGRDPGGCAPDARFLAPAPGAAVPWVALVARGDCPLQGRVLAAARGNASALVVYDEGHGGDLEVTPARAGTGNIVVIMVSHPKGREILDLVQKGILVKMTIQIGSSHVQLIDSHQPFVFAFITVMIISLASLIFYCAQYFLYTGSPFRNQSYRKETKKVIGQLPLHTVKDGEKGVDVDAENCAVCIENFKVNDLVRILPCKESLRGGGHCLLQLHRLALEVFLLRLLSAVFLGEDRSTGSNLLSSSSSSLPSTSEVGPHCAATCAEDTGENTALLGDSVEVACL